MYWQPSDVAVLLSGVQVVGPSLGLTGCKPTLICEFCSVNCNKVMKDLCKRMVLCRDRCHSGVSV